MPEFALNSRITTVAVSMQTIQELETFIVTRVAELTEWKQQIKEGEFKVNIGDSSGTESLTRIKEYPYQRFPETTQFVTLKLLHLDYDDATHKSYRDFSIVIKLTRDYPAEIDVRIHTKNAREDALGIHDGLKRILEMHTTRNWLTKFPALLGSLWLAACMGLFAWSVWFYQRQNLLSGTMCLLFIAITAIYFIFLPRLSDYVEFDSNSTDRKRKTRDALIWVLAIGGVLNILTSIIANLVKV